MLLFIFSPVIPETPEAVLNTKKTNKFGAKLPDDELTPSKYIQETFPIFIPETPTSAGHQHHTKSFSRRRQDSAKKNSGVTGRKIGFGARRTERQDADKPSMRGDKFSSIKSFVKSAGSSLDEETTASPDLLGEMLQEFAESRQTTNVGKRSSSQQKPPRQGGSGIQVVQGTGGINPFKAGSHGVISALGHEQTPYVSVSGANTPSVLAKSSEQKGNICIIDISPGGPQKENHPGVLTSASPARYHLNDKNEQETDHLEQMLQEYSSSSFLNKTTDCKISHKDAKSQIATIGDRQVFRARRPSSKLSRTFRKNNQFPKSGASPRQAPKPSGFGFDESSSGRDKVSTKMNKEVTEHKNDCLNSASSAEDVEDLVSSTAAGVVTSYNSTEEDLFDSATKVRTANPFALKPSNIKINASVSHQHGRSQLTTGASNKTRLNMRKRSPCKGSSPYAKRVSTSHTINDIQNMDSSIASVKMSTLFGSLKDLTRSPQNCERETAHNAFAAKKSLFQEEKENLSNLIEIATEGSPAGHDTSPRNLVDRSTINGFPGTNLDGNLPEKSMPVEVGKTGIPPGKVGIVSRTSLFTGSPVVTQDTSLLPLVGFEPSPGSDALWEDDLDDSVLAAIDMENLGNDMKSEVRL